MVVSQELGLANSINNLKAIIVNDAIFCELAGRWQETRLLEKTMLLLECITYLTNMLSQVSTETNITK